MMQSKYRYLIPNGFTFISLTCGIVSILFSATGNFVAAGSLIVASFVLDLFDGFSARKLNAGSEFGLQLDSLVDMVSLGVAPTVLAFMHLQAEGLPAIWLWPACISITLAGAFRLARFNLLPPKESSSKDSVGLTISSGGATIALAVLADLIEPAFIEVLDILYIPFLFGVSLLMVSKVSFPSVGWVFTGKVRVPVLLVLFYVTISRYHLFNAWFFWNNLYLGVSIARAGYKSFRPAQT